MDFRNPRQPSALGKRNDLLVRDIEVGWLDRSLLPSLPDLADGLVIAEKAPQSNLQPRPK